MRALSFLLVNARLDQKAARPASASVAFYLPATDEGDLPKPAKDLFFGAKSTGPLQRKVPLSQLQSVRHNPSCAALDTAVMPALVAGIHVFMDATL
jgi:hypothetical protein